ncbi:SMI1/KNR4 family protein [Streptomyces sp. MMS20-AI2-20]|uniref:SMI1/KNR4 family protein n=1 Tax=Streptomyces TaxID=1883 RepID=UPI001F61EEC3|nr:SMI1/KNR4 family protein [Streptomyces sp. MMS20-AI2-20]MCI4145836.1 SMI1/KNR4 family protein [Streptomyces sp. MMS20-AI2-20]
MPSLHDVATWQPLLRLLHAAHADTLSAPGGHVAGQIGTGGWSVPLPYRPPQPGRAALISDNQEEFDAIGLIVEALKEEGSDGISFVVEAASAPGRVRLHLIEPSPSVEPGVATAHPGRLLLADGALPEPVRRLPEPVPGAAPAASADVDLLRRTLRERLPDAVGASEEELAAAEARLGVTLPPELRALYEVVRSRYEDCDDSREPYDVIGCDLFPLSEVYIADAASRQVLWQFGAMDAVETGPEHAVQQLVGSPGWIVFGDNGGGDRIAVDLTPGPDGHVGQVIIIGHEGNIGAGLVADSLTDMVVHRHFDGRPVRKVEQPPLVAYVNRASLPSVEAASHPGLEVLSIGVWEKEPVSLAPVFDLPRLRTLSVYSGTLADPCEIARLTRLEYLELPPAEWRVLLDAGAVPKGLLAAGIDAHRQRDNPLHIIALANEILTLYGRPPITGITVLEGAAS